MDIRNVGAELDSNAEGTFLGLVEFNGHSVGACSVTGVSPVWEMHPDTDELFYIIEGRFEIVLLEENGERRYSAGAGSVFVVPKGVWHKPGAPGGARFLYHTPGRSLHSDAQDPSVSDD